MSIIFVRVCTFWLTHDVIDILCLGSLLAEI